jgi:hypothetical protein
MHKGLIAGQISQAACQRLARREEKVFSPMRNGEKEGGGTRSMAVSDVWFSND